MPMNPNGGLYIGVASIPKSLGTPLVREHIDNAGLTKRWLSGANFRIQANNCACDESYDHEP
jgi:hypothetical protein